MICTPKATVSLAPLTAYHVGGTAQWLSQPTTIEALAQALTWAKAQGMPITILGAGTNVLISDQGIGGLVINTRHLMGITWGAGGQIRACAGEPLARLAWLSARKGWHGLEWAVGIPGTIGGAAVMNAGAHGWEAAQLITGVEVMNGLGQIHYVRTAELDFKYRHSILQDQDGIVIAVDLQLVPGQDPRILLKQVAQFNHHRRQTQPQGLPNCGSVFRNPSVHPAGWLLERCGLKGYAVGGAKVAQEHANFILNCNQAKAQDILTLMGHMKAQVHDRWGVSLQTEVKLLGNFAVEMLHPLA